MDSDIARFRRFNRFYTRLLGLLGKEFLGGPFTLTEARLLFELEGSPGVTAAELGARLAMDPGQVSRILAGFMRRELVRKATLREDRRSAGLWLTAAGSAAMRALEARSEAQAAGLLVPLGAPARRELSRAMETIETALGAAGSQPATVIGENGPGGLGYVLASHGRLYHQEYGFDADFERYVCAGLARYLEADQARSRLWIASAGAAPLGSIAMVASGEAAQLRWFLVEPGQRGRGLGRSLLDHALSFARAKGFARVFLWTLDILPAARRLYQSAGFRCLETRPRAMLFGREMAEERWELAL
jgi:DNA-binding MarR family transcriptional regulator/GNAT superfamily N-acetyltransferase